MSNRIMDYKMDTFSEISENTECNTVSLDDLSEYISLFQKSQAKKISTDDYLIAVNPGNLPLDRFFELEDFAIVVDPSLPKRTTIFGFDVYIDRVLPVGTCKLALKLTPKWYCPNLEIESNTDFSRVEICGRDRQNKPTSEIVEVDSVPVTLKSIAIETK